MSKLDDLMFEASLVDVNIEEADRLRQELVQREQRIAGLEKLLEKIEPWLDAAAELQDLGSEGLDDLDAISQAIELELQP